MKKISRVWKIGIFFFSILFSFFVFLPAVAAQSKDIDLNGLWTSSTGATVQIRHSGTILIGIIQQSGSSSLRAGSTNVDGKIKNNTFSGNMYLRALTRKCSFLDGLYPATGAVSADGNSISFRFEDRKYDADTCGFTGEVQYGTITYTRIPVSPSPSPTPTLIPIVTRESTNSVSTNVSPHLPREIPGFAQALIDKTPQASDFKEIPRSDFVKVYPVATVSALPRSATTSSNVKDTVFIGKVGSAGEVVIGLPDGRTTILKDDKSAYEGEMSSLAWRFRNTYVPPPEHPYVKIVEEDCHLTVANNNRNQSTIEPTIAFRERYAEIWNAQMPPGYVRVVGDCTYIEETGSARVQVEQGSVTFKILGGVAVSANKSDFGIGYDAKSALSIVEAYNGTVLVTNKSGQTKKISTVYGSKIKRIEVDKDSTMTEKTAVPQSQWQAFLASQQKESKSDISGNTASILRAIVVLGVGGVLFFLYRTGKLIPFYKRYSQKISGLFRKTNSKNREKGKN